MEALRMLAMVATAAALAMVAALLAYRLWELPGVLLFVGLAAGSDGAWWFQHHRNVRIIPRD